MTSPDKQGGFPQIRIVFMGTSGFAATLLEGLVQNQANIVAVYTQTDKPAGRKQEAQASAVKLFAQQHLSVVPIEQPLRFNDETIAQLKQYQPDLIVVAAYGRILPQAVLDMPGFGCVNVHASLLPRWRGASPIQNALLAGDEETGVTLIQMEATVDTGPVIAQEKLPITPLDTTTTLSEKLAMLGSQLLIQTLPRWIERTIDPVPQSPISVTLCQLIEREDGHVFWNEDAEVLERKCRALTPWPGLFTFWRRAEHYNLRIKILATGLQKTDPETKRRVGEVFEIGEHIGVHCGKGILLLTTLQIEGKNPNSAKEFLLGYPDFIGSVLE